MQSSSPATGSPVDLTTCDREPIHIPGAIQPHGVLIALRTSDLTATHVSANSAELLGVAPQQIVGAGIGAFLHANDVARVEESLRATVATLRPRYLFTVHSISGTPYDAIAHRSGDLLVIELEPARAAAHTVIELYGMVHAAIEELRTADSLNAMYSQCARHVRCLAGFDRVMIYRFDADWNGTIVAEDKRADLEPFVGLHYPAADIPRQARELYTRSWLRFIASRSYQPAALVPPDDPASGQVLDLSFSVLRSVSPIHLEYLANMGVGASMSISLLSEGRLWGLIACHHYSPRYVYYDIRTACEMLGQVMSLQLTAREELEVKTRGEHMQAVRANLAERLTAEDDIVSALVNGKPNVLDLVEASGAAIVIGDEIVRIGQTPGTPEILAISDRLLSVETESAYATDALARELQNGSIAAVAAGMLAISVSKARRYQIMWFRTEQVRTVDWAGDPNKTSPKGDESRLSPRGSFSLWKQTVRGRSQPWSIAEERVATDFRRDLADVLIRRAVTLASQNESLREAALEQWRALESERSARNAAERLNRMKDDFVATLSHELRTPLNAILGWTLLLRDSKTRPEELDETVEIIERNARVQAQMIEDLLDLSRITSGKLRIHMQPVNLAGVVDAAIATMRPAASTKKVRIQQMLDPLSGVTVTGDPNRLQQIFWNLVSNAVKFTPKGGRVQVVLERVNSHVEISVSDTGQGISREFLPHVFDRFRQEDSAMNRKHGGLGLGLAIVRNLVELHGGTIYAESAGEGKGATFVVSLPLRVLQPNSLLREPGQHPTVPTRASTDCATLNLARLRVLVVDDEPDARELLRRVLIECKAVVVTAGSAAEGIDMLRKEAFDVLVSDIGMPEQDGYQFITKVRELEESLERTRTPAMALTAYARPEDRRRIMLAGYQVHVAKPVEPSEFLAVIANLGGRI